MASTKISALTTDSTPDRTADFLPTYDASAVGNKKITIENAGGYQLRAYFGTSLSPADATTYYFSPYPGFGLITTAANHKIRVPRAGVVRRIYIEGVIATATGTAETSTISFRLNDTTDTTITSTAAFNASPISISNTGLSITLAQGDYFTVKWVTPTWVTNPTGLTMCATIWIA